MNFNVWTILMFSYVMVFIQRGTVFSKRNKLMYCIANETLSSEMEDSSCRTLLNLKSQNVDCYVAIDRVTCLRYLIHGKVDFMITEPEDLMMLGLSQDNSNETLVTHQFLESVNSDLFNEMIIVVHNTIQDIWHIRQKRFCSTGFGSSPLTRDYIKYFANKITHRSCDREKTVLENIMDSLSRYFEAACISGPWTTDYQYDRKLKKKYKNLCARCRNTTLCSNKDLFFGKSGALKCLIYGKGDITWTTAGTIRQHLEEMKYNNISKDYSILCPDGSARSLMDKPCILLEEPPRTIAVRIEAVKKLKKFIKKPENKKDVWNLFQGMPSNIKTPATPLDYLERSYPEYYSLKYSEKCTPDRSIKWCVTTSLEAEKCKWLSLAAESHGVEPLINCRLEKSRNNCMESIKTGTSDIFVVQSQEKIEAEKKGLKTIAHMLTSDGNEDTTVVLISKSFHASSLFDLRNRRACFTGYRDSGWKAFTHMMNKLTGNYDWHFKDKKAVSEFFSESCVADLTENEGEEDFSKNLYSLCSQGNLEARNSKQAMMNCVHYNNADIVFVNASSLRVDFADVIGNIYDVYCFNEITNFRKEQCYSGGKSLGLFMVNENVTETRKDDIYLMLMDIDRLFGTTYHFSSKSISLYGPFEESSSIMFSEGTQYIHRKNGSFPCNYNMWTDILSHLHTKRPGSLIREICLTVFLLFVSIFIKSIYNILSISDVLRF